MLYIAIGNTKLLKIDIHRTKWCKFLGFWGISWVLMIFFCISGFFRNMLKVFFFLFFFLLTAHWQRCEWGSGYKWVTRWAVLMEWAVVTWRCNQCHHIPRATWWISSHRASLRVCFHIYKYPLAWHFETRENKAIAMIRGKSPLLNTSVL